MSDNNSCKKSAVGSEQKNNPCFCFLRAFLRDENENNPTYLLSTLQKIMTAEEEEEEEETDTRKQKVCCQTADGTLLTEEL